jgi:hypothetical protein
MDALPKKVAAYRTAFAASGYRGRGHVVLMLHAFLDEDFEVVERLARKPLQRYLITALDLNLRASGLPVGARPVDVEEGQVPLIIKRAYDRYLTQDGLFGAVSDAMSVVERARAADVDEIACLIDFGVPVEATLCGLDRLNELRISASHPVTT